MKIFFLYSNVLGQLFDEASNVSNIYSKSTWYTETHDTQFGKKNIKIYYCNLPWFDVHTPSHKVYKISTVFLRCFLKLPF